MDNISSILNIESFRDKKKLNPNWELAKEVSILVTGYSDDKHIKIFLKYTKDDKIIFALNRAKIDWKEKVDKSKIKNRTAYFISILKNYL
jgi:hypothetical protein